MLLEREHVFDLVLDGYIERIATCVMQGILPHPDLYMAAYSRVYTTYGHKLEQYTKLCWLYLAAFSEIADDDGTYYTFANWMARVFDIVNRINSWGKRSWSTYAIANQIRQEKKRRQAARVIQRALWRCVQRRQQLELLDELYRPGGIGAIRAQKRFEDLTKNFV